MDNRQWESLHLRAPLPRKRPWDPTSTSVDGEMVGPGPGAGQEDYGHAEWKRRRPALPPHGGSGWDTTDKTSLWLAQQEENCPSHRQKESGRGFSGEHGLVSSPSTFRAVTIDDQSLSDEQRFSRPRGWPQYGHEYRIESRDDHRPAAARPQRLAVFSGVDQRCDKCLRGVLCLQDAVSNLNKLAESLSSGPLYEAITQSRQTFVPHNQAPHVVDVHRILDLAQEANDLTKHLVQAAATNYLQNARNTSPEDIQAPLQVMKRNFPGDSREVLNKPRQPSEINVSPGYQDYASGHELALPFESRRQSLAGLVGSDRLPPIRPYSPTQPLQDGCGFTLPSMKPPPTPSRHLLSPGRSHASPPPFNIPSPNSTLGRPSFSYPGSLPNIHHPLSPTLSSSLGITATTGAVQAHTAALQHEVSVKKYALETLQDEHNKLHSAYRRSQMRARTLEEKQVTSDREINTLSEDHARLLAQIAELEQGVSDLSKSRDEFRQATVKEGAQYEQIVKQASQLEKMAGEERREWTRRLKESEAGRAQAYLSVLEAGKLAAAQQSSSADQQASPDEGSVEDLKREVRRLSGRCGDLASTLRSIRSEAQRVSEAVGDLGPASNRILDHVNGALPDKAVVAPSQAPAAAPDAG